MRVVGWGALLWNLAYPKVVVADQGFVALCDGVGDRLVAEPGLNNDVGAERQVPD